MVGVLPIHNGADQDAHFKTEQFKGWFEELSNPDKYRVRDAADPSRKSRRVLRFHGADQDFQEVLLGKKTPKEVADEWAAFLTERTAEMDGQATSSNPPRLAGRIVAEAPVRSRARSLDCCATFPIGSPSAASLPQGAGTTPIEAMP